MPESILDTQFILILTTVLLIISIFFLVCSANRKESLQEKKMTELMHKLDILELKLDYSRLEKGTSPIITKKVDRTEPESDLPKRKPGRPPKEKKGP